MPRYAASRQKACTSCSTAKTRCDRKAGQCTRCALRGLSCAYPLGTQLADSAADATTDSNIAVAGVTAAYGPSVSAIPLGADAQYSARNRTSPAALRNRVESITTELFCPIDADAIKNRWLHAHLSASGLYQKSYSTAITAFIYRILNSYVGIVIRGYGIPPFVHTSHMMAINTMPALSTCLTLVRMCCKPLPGSEHVIVDTIQGEMKRLYDQHRNYNEVALFAAFQAYLVYCMVLFFRLNEGSLSFRRQAMTDLQTLACASSRGGLACVAESISARPRWEAWIVAEAKRRTLFTMYLFDSLLAAEEGLPTPIGIELKELSGPASRQLWTASTRQGWETAYGLYRADWVRGFCIDELWPLPENLDESEILARRSRVDRWLEDVDEFGTMLYAITCSTHGV